MIIFYEKTTGQIKGTVDGRIHGEAHLKMGMENCDNLVINWKPIAFYDLKGNVVDKDAVDRKGKRLAVAADFEPQHEQKDLFVMLDKTSNKIYDYKVDVDSKLLVLK